MYDENRTRRTYRLKKRADAVAETRRRITEAAVALHGSVGPSRTTVSAVARRAGVLGTGDEEVLLGGEVPVDGVSLDAG